jgi:hypothetical protein
MAIVPKVTQHALGGRGRAFDQLYEALPIELRDQGKVCLREHFASALESGAQNKSRHVRASARSGAF